MSFHGGFLGVFIAAIIFTRKHNIKIFALLDLLAIVVPIGIFFGRISNFINGELWGRPSGDFPYGMIFPYDNIPRYPSQLFEAFSEGIVLFAILMLLEYKGLRKKTGMISGFFLICYAVARIICEFFRQPDVQLGFIAGSVTMGQILSLPLLLLGIILVCKAKNTP